MYKMDTFYLIVLGIATLILILLLAFMGWTISNANKTTRYPTITTTCPDNWIPVPTDANPGLCQRPADGKYNFGKVELTPYMTVANGAVVPKSKVGVIAGDSTKMNFKSDVWSGTDIDPTCAKRKSANNLGRIGHNTRTVAG